LPPPPPPKKNWKKKKNSKKFLSKNPPPLVSAVILKDSLRLIFASDAKIGLHNIELFWRTGTSNSNGLGTP